MMKRTPPARQARDPVMRGTVLLSQRSPVSRLQSWVSLQRLGVIQARFGVLPARSVES